MNITKLKDDLYELEIKNIKIKLSDIDKEQLINMLKIIGKEARDMQFNHYVCNKAVKLKDNIAYEIYDRMPNR